jgi:hypothetical protein
MKMYCRMIPIHDWADQSLIGFERMHRVKMTCQGTGVEAHVCSDVYGSPSPADQTAQYGYFRLFYSHDLADPRRYRKTVST